MKRKKKTVKTYAARKWLNPVDSDATGHIRAMVEMTTMHWEDVDDPKKQVLVNAYTENCLEIADCYKKITLDTYLHDDDTQAKKVFRKIDILIDVLTKYRAALEETYVATRELEKQGKKNMQEQDKKRALKGKAKKAR